MWENYRCFPPLRFLININDRVAGLSCVVPLSDHVTRKFPKFHMQVGMMWVFVHFSHFSQRLRSHAERHNVQCKRLCYFKPAAPSPSRHCFNGRCTFALLSSCACVGVKMRRGEGHFWESIISGQRHLPEVWKMRAAAASAPWRAPRPSASQTRKIYRININLWNVLAFFSLGWLIKRPSSIILDFVSATIFCPLSSQWIWLFIYSRPMREAPVYPHIENVTITLQTFTERFCKYIISMCDYTRPTWRKASRKDCWWAMNYCTSREVQSNQLLTSHSEAGA